MQPEGYAPRGAVAIPLRRRDGSVAAYTWVDKDDAPEILQYRWSLHSTGRAVRGVYESGSQRTYHVRMHRQLMGLTRYDGLEVDHINRDPLDNRRKNLRVCTHAQNRQNNGPRKDNTSGYLGVTWDPTRKKWKGQVQVNYTNHFVGRFTRKKDAAKAVSEFRRQHVPFSACDQ